MARLKSQFDFIAGMYFDSELYFNKYALTVDFYTSDESAQDQNIALDRISYLIFDTISRSIFVNENDMKIQTALAETGILALAVPDPGPFDPVVLAALVNKMNSVLEGVLVITEAELISEISSPLTYIWDVNDETDEIHEMVNLDDPTKWWASADPRFGSYPEGTDVAKVEKKSPFPLTWDMLDLGWSDEDSTDEKTFIADVATKSASKKNGTVIKADFNTTKKPKK